MCRKHVSLALNLLEMHKEKSAAAPEPHFDQLFAALAQFPSAQVAKHIMLALPSACDESKPGALTLTKAISLLGWEEFIPTLIDCSIACDQVAH